LPPLPCLPPAGQNESMSDLASGLLLLHPPVSKPCEPPAGIARLAGAMQEYGVPCEIIDANVEGLRFLLAMATGRDSACRWAKESCFSADGANIPVAMNVCGPGKSAEGGDTWTKRAVRNLPRHVQELRAWPVYCRPDRYRRAVADINRVLKVSSPRPGIVVSLTDYQDRDLSPVDSRDLLAAAAQPERNPFFSYFRELLVPRIRRRRPRVIGISVNYFSQALGAFAMIGTIRAFCPPVRIVLGGGLITSWRRQARWRNPFGTIVDDLVAGPGEAFLLSLFHEEHDGKISPAPVSCPDYRSVSWSSYLAPGPILPYSASSGCYWRRCRFCPETAEQNPYLSRPPEQILADLARLKNETKPVLIHFLDNAMSPALLKALALNPVGVPWYGFVRITAHLADVEFCRRLRDGGCIMLKMGLESGDQEVLDRLGKGIDLATAARALRNLKAAGIATYVYLLFGTPAEDLAAARRTLAYVEANAAGIDFLNIALFNMPAFAAAASGLATRPFSAGDLSLYEDFAHPRGWNRREVRRFIDGEVKRSPGIAAILSRTPPAFTSNHAPLFRPRSL